MTPIDNATGNVNPLGNQAATQKKATHSTDSSKEKTERVEAGREASSGEVQTDTVEITSNRTGDVEAAQNVPENEAEAAALLADIQRQIQQEEQQQLERVHNMSGERMVEILA